MKLATITHKDGSVTVQLTIETYEGFINETMTLGEWSQLIANPTAVVEEK